MNFWSSSPSITQNLAAKRQGTFLSPRSIKPCFSRQLRAMLCLTRRTWITKTKGRKWRTWGFQVFENRPLTNWQVSQFLKKNSHEIAWKIQCKNLYFPWSNTNTFGFHGCIIGVPMTVFCIFLQENLAAYVSLCSTPRTLPRCRITCNHRHSTWEFSHAQTLVVKTLECKYHQISAASLLAETNFTSKTTCSINPHLN